MPGCPPLSMLDDYILGSLGETERKGVEDHIERCATCHAALVEREFARIRPPERSTLPGGRGTVVEEARGFDEGRLIGPYRLIKELGRGGQARVLLVSDTRLPRRVALKLFEGGLAASDHVLQRFQREAAALSRIDHPGICTVHETGEWEGHPFIAMRYVEGESLAQRIARRAASADPKSHVSRQPGDLMETVFLIERAARALHAAHEMGLVHRDIKPSNILISTEGEPVIVDFGLARNEQASERRLTQTGDLAGTPDYMSPEQVRGEMGAIDRRSDVFSLGVTLYEALVLKLPFDAPTTAAVFQRILAGPWTPPSTTGLRLPKDLLVILETALELDRDRRYQSALAFAEDLKRYREHQTILARPAGRGLRLRRWSQRNPVVAVSLVAAFLILATALGISIALLDRVQRESDARAQALRREEGLRLALQSSAVLPENPGRALLLAIEAADCAPSLAANNALLSAVQASQEQARLLGHSGMVNRASFSQDGLRVITASSDKTARVWDSSSGKALAILQGHGGEVRTAEFSPNGKRVLTAALDATARLWDPETGKELLRLTGHSHGLLLASFSPDGSRILTIGQGTARLWDAGSGQSLHVLASHRAPIQCAAFSPDGACVATGSQDKSVILWDASSGAIQLTLKGHGETITALGFSGDSAKLITAAQDGGAIIWDARSGTKIAALQGHEHPIRSVRLSTDGSIAATGSDDFGARVWDGVTGKERFVFRHDHAVYCLALSRDGRLLVTASLDSKARLWGTGSGKLLAELKGHGSSILHVEFSPTEERVVTAAVDSTARVWSLRPAWPKSVSGEIADSVEMAWLDARVERVAALREPHTSVADVVRLGKGAGIVTLVGHQGPITALRFHPNGQSVLTTSKDATARLWDAETGKLVREFRGHDGPVLAARFSADGHRFATPSEDHTVRVWDTETGFEIARVTGPQSPYFIASLSPDGRHVICGAKDASLVLANADTGEVVRLLEDASKYLRSVEWRADGRRVVVASATTRIEVRDPFTGKGLGALIHPAGCDFALYSPDGRWIGTECLDFTVRIWDAQSHEEVLQVKVGLFMLGAISFDALGRRIAAFSVERHTQIDPQATAKGRLILLPLDPLDASRRLRPGVLTPDERDQFQVGSPEARAAYRASWSGGGALGAQ